MARLTPRQKAQAASRQVAMLRVQKKLSRKRKIPTARYPKLIESEYAAAILRYLSPAIAVLRAHTSAIPALARAGRRARRDALRGLVDYYDADPPDDEEDDDGDENAADKLAFIVAAGEAHAQALIAYEALVSLAKNFALRVAIYNRTELGKQVKAALGADILPVVEPSMNAIIMQFAQQNARLIKSIPSEYWNDVAKLSHHAMTSAEQVKSLETLLQEKFEFKVESRARLIARDQISKLYGDINQYRQQSIGIERFFWRTMEDEKVRTLHVKLGAGEGGPYSWESPATEGEGYPSDPVNCRCYAEPDFTSILGPDDDVTEEKGEGDE